MNATLVRAVLSLGNLILSSANVIIGFSLFVYILTHNLRNPVARAFCALIAFVTAAYVADVSLADVASPEAANLWLRLQWVGIAFVPAAYFHFSDALLRTTGSISRWRRVGVASTYMLGFVAFGLVALSSLIVRGVGQKDDIYHLLAGPLFWPFTAYYVVTSVGGWLNIRRAHTRCLTSTSRRRMAYLMWAFVAPGVGVFPFLLVPTTAEHLSANIISLLALVGNVGIALMTVVIGYAVAYQGALLPDRVIKHSLIHYLLRGPVVGILVIVLMLTIPHVEHILGIQRDTILIVAVAGTVVVAQVLVNVAKPAIDRLIYRRDRQEVAWIQSLDQRLLTTTDLEQLLENTLIALCDLLRLPSGFIVTVDGGTLSLRVFCGAREAAETFLAYTTLPDMVDALTKSRAEEMLTNADFILGDGHWLLPLRGRTDPSSLGILGLAATETPAHFGEQDLAVALGLVRRAEFALEDIQLQQRIFALLQGLGNELDQIQEWRSIPRYVGERTLPALEAAIADQTRFVQLVRDALSQFWGGPKLSQSPLLGLRIVRDRLKKHDQVPAKAVRAVLQEAIERLKPSGERSLTASEWMVYNILDLKYVQGQRIRDIAQRMAMSESDFYRKQRVAIEQVAETLRQMEQTEGAKLKDEG
jgi:hypothetical protein